MFVRTKHTAHRACNLVSRECQRKCFQFCLSSEVTSSHPTRCMKTTRPGKNSHLCILYMCIEWTVLSGVPQIKLLLVFAGNLNSIIRKKLKMFKALFSLGLKSWNLKIHTQNQSRVSNPGLWHTG